MTQLLHEHVWNLIGVEHDLVFDMIVKHGTPKMKEVPPALCCMNVQSLINQGVPVGVAEGFRDSWQKSSHAKPALHKHDLILKLLNQNGWTRIVQVLKLHG